MTMNVRPYETATEVCRVYESRTGRKASHAEMTKAGFTMVSGRSPYWSKFRQNDETFVCEERVQGTKSVVISTMFKSA